MCIAILARCGKSLTEEQIDNCWKINSDGAGFAYTSRGKIVLVKELKSLEKFKRLYFKHLPQAALSPMLIHFRIRTHGEISIANTQPIQVSKNCVFIHNGVISGVPSHKKHSDTVMFSKLVLSQFREGFQEVEAIRDMIRSGTGASKLVFLQTNGNAYIVNEKAGDWDDDIWYSNWSHKSYSTKKTTTENGVVYNYTGCGYRNDAVPDRVLGRVVHSYTGAQTSPPPPQRLLALPTQLTLTELPLVTGEIACNSCYEDFSVGDKWFEIYGKHIVCPDCYKEFENSGIFFSEQGVFVAPPVEDITEEDLYAGWAGGM